ncbi:MAG TPA: beta-N-acetylhexosaminidase [Caproicibacter sp.]|nr:beta-N-acetylhexosaminidase [Caproicibacter sp.]
MKIDFTGCDGTARYLLQEIQPILGFILSKGGTKLSARQTDAAGFAVSECNGEIEVLYNGKVDFCRAIAAVCAREGQVGWTLSESCAFEEFGLTLDLSRNAVMRPGEIQRFLRFAALMGYRFLGLYMEDTVKLQDEPCFGNMRGALSPEQLQELDHYAESLGIELRAYVQTLAHINQITRYAVYEPIVDTGDILLTGDERTYELLDHLLGTISKSIRCRKVNIGMDEATMAGLGKYLERNGYHRRSDVILQHLNRVLEICRKYGLRAQMWSDLFFHQVNGSGQLDMDQLSKIPPDVELAYWDYYSCDIAHYRHMLKKHHLLADRVAFATGAWKWTGFTPHNHYSMEVGEAALKACLESDVQSVVVTTWGDDGAEASAFSVLPTLYTDAQLAYNAPREPERFRCIAGISLDDFLRIDLPCRFSERKGVHNNAAKYLLYQDVLYGTFDSVVTDTIPEFYHEAAEQLSGLCSQGSFGYLFETQMWLCRVLSHKANLGKQILAAYQAKDKAVLNDIAENLFAQLLRDLSCFREAFCRQWMRENTPFGFEVQTIRLGGLEARLRDVQKLLQAYVNGAIDHIEELDAQRIPFSYFEQQDIEQLNYNLWGNIVSPGVIG